MQKDYQVVRDFAALLQDQYHAQLEQLDFAGEAEASRHTVNQWVETVTHNNIRELIQPGVFTDQTRLVLTNAIYFKGKWLIPFAISNTHDEDFTVSPGHNVHVPFMHLQGRFYYHEEADFTALELPYKGNALSMVIILPKKPEGLAKLEQKLTFPTLQQWLETLETDQCSVTLSFPKFETTQDFSLKEVMQAMGIKDAFDPVKADFSGMAARATLQKNGENLYVDTIIHKAYIEVDEEGTKAAAATAPPVPVAPTALPPTCIKTFHADHPFIFLIRDNHSGLLLFMGRIDNPL